MLEMAGWKQQTFSRSMATTCWHGIATAGYQPRGGWRQHSRVDHPGHSGDQRDERVPWGSVPCRV